MSLIHNLFVGHFLPHDGFIRFQEGIPVCEKPLDMLVLSELLDKHLGKGVSIDNIPAKWGMSVTSDYIIGNRYGLNQVLNLIADYAKRKQAIIVDMGCSILLNPEDLQQSVSVREGLP